MQSVFVLAELPLHDLLPRIRRGLPVVILDQVASALGFSNAVLAQKLGIAQHTLTHTHSGGELLSMEASEKVLRVARMRNLARILFSTDEAISQWLSKPNAALDGMAPIDLLDTELGAHGVENLLRTLAHGQFT